jgi:hypothetical protein
MVRLLVCVVRLRTRDGESTEIVVAFVYVQTATDRSDKTLSLLAASSAATPPLAVGSTPTVPGQSSTDYSAISSRAGERRAAPSAPPG